MRAQTEAALADADAILFVIDARVGVTPHDRHFADLVRRAGKPVILLANKAESRAGHLQTYEAFGLGLGDPIPLSAEHGEGLSELYDALRAALPEQTMLDRRESIRSRRERGRRSNGRFASRSSEGLMPANPR